MLILINYTYKTSHLVSVNSLEKILNLHSRQQIRRLDLKVLTKE